MFRLGADYYPEHWPKTRWEIDAQLMAEAGFNVARLAEFAWMKMEPQPGIFDFEWLDRAIQILHKKGISVVLGTPTASPPVWLAHNTPEVLRVLEDGRRVAFGTRRINCPSHPLYRERSRIITQAMANHFGDNPAVIGWQTDNEFGDRCFCSNCCKAFHVWLKKRYGEIDIINERYGTVFWSQTFLDWDQITLPLTNIGAPPNPSLALDFRRFMSDTWFDFQQEQIDILRAQCPNHFVTHDMMGFGYDSLDYFDIAKPLDFVSWNNYPLGFWHKWDNDSFAAALSHDAMRGLKGKNFWVMEQQAGPSGWQTLSTTPSPGVLRLWAYQSIAHGADGVLFFRWRTARFGAEQYWHGLLEHDGRAGRRYHEIKAMGMELKRIGEQIFGADTRSKVAILHTYDTRFAFQVQGNSDEFSYEILIAKIYAALWRRNISVDVVSPASDISKYDLIFAPALHIVTEEIAAKFREFTRNGGTLVITPRTGVKDDANMVVNLPLPGLLADLCGVIVDEYDALQPISPQSIRFESGPLTGQILPVKLWCDVLAPQGAAVLARYTDGYYAGAPAITRNQFGAGQAMYLGAFGADAFYDAVFGWLLAEKGISAPLDVPSGVAVRERWQGDHVIYFVLNFSGEPQLINLPAPQRNLLDNTNPSCAISLPANGIMILENEM